MAREQAAVTARDYERATQIKSAQVQALKTFDTIRSFDFNLMEYTGVGAVATAFGGASGVGLVPVKVHIVQPVRHDRPLWALTVSTRRCRYSTWRICLSRCLDVHAPLDSS